MIRKKSWSEEKKELHKRLYDLYITQNKGPSEIAFILNSKPYTISNQLRDCNLRKKRASIYFLPEYGQRFNKLIFLEELPNRNQKGQIIWKMKCDCGKIKNIYYYRVVTNRTMSCNCINKQITHKNKYSGYMDISGKLWNKIVTNGIRRKLIFDIDIEYVWEIFIKQNKKCALSGEDLFFHIHNDTKTNASLDRINSNIGYIKGNVQWVTKKINAAKQALSDEEFIELCKNVYMYRKLLICQ